MELLVGLAEGRGTAPKLAGDIYQVGSSEADIGLGVVAEGCARGLDGSMQKKTGGEGSAGLGDDERRRRLRLRDDRGQAEGQGRGGEVEGGGDDNGAAGL